MRLISTARTRTNMRGRCASTREETAEGVLSRTESKTRSAAAGRGGEGKPSAWSRVWVIRLQVMGVGTLMTNKGERQHMKTSRRLIFYILCVLYLSIYIWGHIKSVRSARDWIGTHTYTTFSLNNYVSTTSSISQLAAYFLLFVRYVCSKPSPTNKILR